MGIFKAVFAGVSGLGLVASLALSFAPTTALEEAALGPNAPRMMIVQRRLAIGLRDLAPASMQQTLAQSARLSDDQFIAALDQIIDPPDTTPSSVQVAQTEPQETDRSIRAGGALFVRVD